MSHILYKLLIILCCTAATQNINYGKPLAVAGKSCGSPGGATTAGRRRDLAEGNIRGQPEAGGQARGLAEVVAFSMSLECPEPGSR